MESIESFHAFLDPIPEESFIPPDPGVRCSICDGVETLKWYITEEPTDASGHFLHERVLARWWELCADCQQLVADDELQPLIARTGSSRHPMSLDVMRRFLECARPWS